MWPTRPLRRLMGGKPKRRVVTAAFSNKGKKPSDSGEQLSASPSSLLGSQYQRVTSMRQVQPGNAGNRGDRGAQGAQDSNNGPGIRSDNDSSSSSSSKTPTPKSPTTSKPSRFLKSPRASPKRQMYQKVQSIPDLSVASSAKASVGERKDKPNIPMTASKPPAQTITIQEDNPVSHEIPIVVDETSSGEVIPQPVQTPTPPPTKNSKAAKIQSKPKVAAAASSLVDEATRKPCRCADNNR